MIVTRKSRILNYLSGSIKGLAPRGRIERTVTVSFEDGIDGLPTGALVVLAVVGVWAIVEVALTLRTTREVHY